MSKQFTFCANESDDVLFLEIIKRVFPNPYSINRSPMDKNPPLKNLEKFTIIFTDEKYLDHLEYFDKQKIDGTFEKVFDMFESPVIEYSPSVKGFEDGIEFYGFGRFYCAFSKNKEFSKEVSKLFRLIKKECHYFKDESLYVSKSIDLDTAIFYSRLKDEFCQLG